MTATKTVNLGDVSEFINGAAFGPEDWGAEGKRIIRIQNLTGQSEVFNRTTREVDTKYHVHPGELLVSWSATLGVYEWEGPDIGLVNQHIFRVVPDAKQIEKRYLMRALDLAIGRMTRHTHGSTMKHINRREFLETTIPLPPLAEQKRIAAVLDKADDLRGKRRQALATLDTLLQSVFLDMFGDPVTNPKGWPRVRLDDLLSIRRGGSPRPIEQYLGGTINWIKIGDATLGDEVYITSCRDKIIPEGLKKTVFLKAGSLIVANSGVSLGFARILKIDGCIHDGWLSFADIPPDRIDKFFLLKAINALTIHLRQIAPSGTQPNLTTDIMKSFSFALPPLPLQQRFAAIMEKVEGKRTASVRATEGMESLFATLQSAAFAGTLFNGEMVKTAASKSARPPARPTAV